MHIGIIGAGNIGTTTARLFVDAGHQVAISNSRGPESLVGLVAALGPNARAMTVDDAAAFGDVVLVAIPFGCYETLPSARLAGKIVVDAMNYYAQRDGRRDFGAAPRASWSRNTSAAPAWSKRSTRCPIRRSPPRAGTTGRPRSAWRCSSPAMIRRRRG